MLMAQATRSRQHPSVARGADYSHKAGVDNPGILRRQPQHYEKIRATRVRQRKGRGTTGYEPFRTWKQPHWLTAHSHTTRWSTARSSRVNLPLAMNFRVLCGANLVTQPSKFGGNESHVLHRVALHVCSKGASVDRNDRAAQQQAAERSAPTRETGGAPNLEPEKLSGRCARTRCRPSHWR